MFEPNLQVKSTSFIGRESELAKIADLLALPDCRLLMLTGAGGIGKTRLALQAVAELQLHFQDGVHFVPLTSINSADLVPAAIASALQVAFFASQDLRTEIVHYLRQKHMLLVLDNFEHVLEAADLLTELLQAAPDLKCVVTSRERLNLREEWTLTLEGLPFPSQNAHEPLEGYSAVQLFVQRASQVQAHFTLNENYEAVQTICQRVEGMPLAIELAATWLRAMPCNQIAAQLDDSLNFLSTPLRNVPERHRNIRTVFEHSWKLLSPAEQHVMMYLSVFRGGFDRESAEQMAGASLPVLASLADKSMIHLNATERYDLHELLRQYAADKLAEAGEAEIASQCHFNYFLKLAETAETHNFGREQIPWFDRLETELDNLRVAVFWSAETEAGLRLVGALAWFISERTHWSEGLGWFERVLAANPEAAPALRAKALCTFATLVGDRQRAEALYDKVIALAKATNDDWNMAWTLSNKGIIAGLDHQYSAELLEASLELFRKIEDPMGLTHTLVRRSWHATQQQDYAYSRLLLDEARIIAQEAGDAIMTGWVLRELGIIAWRHDHDFEQARRHFTGGLAQFTKARFKMGCNGLLLCLAAVEQELGNVEQARLYHHDALLSMQRTYRSDHFVHLVVRGRVYLAWASGQFEQAGILSRVVGHYVSTANAEFSEMTDSEEIEAVLRDSLGEAQFAQVWQAGHPMTLNQAIACLEDAAARISVKSGGQTGGLEKAQSPPSMDEPLTERELEILQALGEGLNSREIAEQLVLSVATIRWYLKHIYGKLDAHSRSQAIARARELRLLV